MIIQQPTPDTLLLVQRRHYAMLCVGGIALVLSLAALFGQHDHDSLLGAGALVAASLLWLGCSSGHGTMLLDRTTATVVVRKWFFGRLRTQQVPFSDIRYGEAARVDRNTHFRLVLRGGATLELASSANMIDNAERVADTVNQFLGLFPPAAGSRPAATSPAR